MSHMNEIFIVIVLALGIVFFLRRKSKLFFVLLFLGLFLAGLFYMISSIADSGSEQKKKLIRDEKQSDMIPSSLFRNPSHFAATELWMEETRFPVLR